MIARGVPQVERVLARHRQEHDEVMHEVGKDERPAYASAEARRRVGENERRDKHRATDVAVMDAQPAREVTDAARVARRLHAVDEPPPARYPLEEHRQPQHCQYRVPHHPVDHLCKSIRRFGDVCYTPAP